MTATMKSEDCCVFLVLSLTSRRLRKDTGRMEHVSVVLEHIEESCQIFLTCILILLNQSLHIVDKEYAGHDITLAIGLMKTDAQWLDRFVKMEQKWIDDAKGWVEYMDAKYPRCGQLDKWQEDQESWPELTEEEKEAINKCVIM